MDGHDFFGSESPKRWLELPNLEGMNGYYHTRDVGLFQEIISLWNGPTGRRKK